MSDIIEQLRSWTDEHAEGPLAHLMRRELMAAIEIARLRSELEEARRDREVASGLFQEQAHATLLEDERAG